MENNRQLSPAQRANLFAQSTRQYKQELPALEFKEGQTVSITLPKTRFLSKIFLKLNIEIMFKENVTFLRGFPSYALRNIRMSINNGFNPYQLGGKELMIYNSVGSFTGRWSGKSTVGGDNYNGIMTLELPITLNERDPIGLIMLQNEQTSVTISIDCGYIKDMFYGLEDKENVEVEYSSFTITPTIETFSIPQLPDAVPDYSILKLVNQQTENLYGGRENIIKLPVGLTYRKIIIIGERIDNNGMSVPLSAEEMGRLQVVFNQADTPYNISFEQLAHENSIDYGQGGNTNTNGVFVLDFSNQGIVNLGGGRDYIDTERLTEFWLKIIPNHITAADNAIAKVTIIKENLARLV